MDFFYQTKHITYFKIKKYLLKNVARVQNKCLFLISAQMSDIILKMGTYIIIWVLHGHVFVLGSSYVLRHERVVIKTLID